MSFQRARNDEQRQMRLNQITDATVELMQELPFDKITMKKIGEKLSFTRNNLYQYVKSKNEIILLIIQKDFQDWYETLNATYSPKKELTTQEFAQIWVKVASQYPRILHWFPLLGELIEKEITVEKLVEFKKNYFNVIAQVKNLIVQVLPQISLAQAEHLIYFHLRVLPHLYHLYHETPAQKEAIKLAGYNVPDRSFITDGALEIQIYLAGLKEFDL